MKRIAIVMFFGIFIILALSSAAGADGHGGWHGGYHGGGWHGGGWHGGFYGSYGFGPWYPYPYAYPYPYYAYPYDAYPAYPSDAPAVPSEPQQTYWYYCKEAQAYYPYVTSCPGGWVPVVPKPPEAGKEAVPQ